MAETIFRDIGVYKNTIISYLLQSPDILEILLGTGYTEEQVIGDDSGKGGVVYSNIFPYLFVQTTQDVAKSYLCIEVDPIIDNKNMKKNIITIWAYSHKDIMQYDKEDFIGTRPDILTDMVDRQLRFMIKDLIEKAKTNSDTKLKIGMGELLPKSPMHIFPATNFYGRSIVYEAPDFTVKNT